MSGNRIKKVAVLDDYAGTAPKHFESIKDVKVSYWDQTLDASKEDDLQALIRRLEPYEIISSMRERTAFPSTLLSHLPNLKLLLTTGMRNNAIDLPAATTHNILVTGTHGDRLPDSHYAHTPYDPPPPATGPSTVIQHSWALLLSLTSKIIEHHTLLQDPLRPTAWQHGTIFPLAGKTLGLVGLGKLGDGVRAHCRAEFRDEGAGLECEFDAGEGGRAGAERGVGGGHVCGGGVQARVVREGGCGEFARGAVGAESGHGGAGGVGDYGGGGKEGGVVEYFEGGFGR